MTQESIQSLATKYLSQTASNEEIQRFESWMAQSEENQELFSKIEMVWTRLEKTYASITINEELAQQKIREQIQKQYRPTIPLYKRNIWRVAASVVLLLGLGLLANQWRITKLNTITYISGDVTREVLLADSSRVWLNSGSTLKVSPKFNGKNRNVHIIGEAYFEVKRNEKIPFIIKTGPTYTQVLGTSFNVKQGNDKSVEVIVSSGKVALFKSFMKQEKLILLPGEKGSVIADGKHLKKELNNDLNYNAWKTRVLTFKDTPLPEVCQAINKYYNVEVIFDSNQNSKQLTGTFTHENLENVLEMISISLDVELTVQLD